MTTLTTTGSGLFYISYIENNKVLTTFNGKNQNPTEIKLYSMGSEEIIQKITPFGVITDKAVYLFRIEANLEECKKYVDVKCEVGFARSAVASLVLTRYSTIIKYFDGYFIVTNDGQLYKLLQD
jgi:hypothetical protein